MDSLKEIKQGDIQCLWKGEMPYRESLSLQEELKQKARKGSRAFFVGFECPSCITLGLRGKKETDLQAPNEDYKGIEVVTIKRGGQATLHSLGQLVIYPVMDLLSWKIRPRDFLSILESITQRTLKQYGVTAEKKEDSAGLFTQNGKIAFFGIHISGGVSQHGLAVNICNDLRLFNLIRSCGITHRPHDSLQKYGLNPGLKEVFSLWCQIGKPTFLDHL